MGISLEDNPELRRRLIEKGIITEEEARPRKPRKYRNQPVDDPVDGHFDSQWEFDHWVTLKTRLRLGEITDLRRQVPYQIRVNDQVICEYVADFVYDEGGSEKIIDAKGYSTSEYKLKRKMMATILGLTIIEVRRPQRKTRPHRGKRNAVKRRV